MRDASAQATRFGLLTLFFSILFWVATAASQTSEQATSKNPVPVINGELGSCSVQLTATDASGQPLSDAKIRVHIAYGFMSIRKLDLEVGTNTEGKARFEGLPEKVKRALEFHASQGKREGTAVIDSTKNCKSEHTIVLTPAP